ncbi:NAD(P)/FAD-dependent oxidoreductase [Candidatus Woesearchaeota archaeon]|nr:NAD(P)/FAD-dependent oxidoreductase [Candidatus Woesearchaeota archaeon]
MITIIGAGPVGCYAASLLAEDFEVTVFEEHKTIGLPVQCTGIVTQEIYRYVPKRNNFVINKTRDVRIFSSNGKHLKLKLEKPDLVINRTRFDNYFYRKAKKQGVKFVFNHRFIAVKRNNALIKDLKSGKIKKIKFSYLIGADGPRSEVAKSTGITRKRKYFVGLQTIVKKKNSNIIDFYPLKHGFAWAVPENKSKLRVGVALSTNPQGCNKILKKLLRKYKGKVIERQGGLIPIFNPMAGIRKNNIFLTGDSAGFVKATTGGGLVQGLKSAEILAHTINNNLSYEAGIYLHLFPSLLLHLKTRNIMDSFSAKDWNQLIKELNTKESKKALQKVNRDKLFQLLFKVAINKPELIKHGLKHVRSLF